MKDKNEVEILSGKVASGSLQKLREEEKDLIFQEMVLKEKLRDAVRSYVFCEESFIYRFLKRHYFRKSEKLRGELNDVAFKLQALQNLINEKYTGQLTDQEDL